MKTTQSGGSSGCDAGKKIKGRKRHIVTDTEGNMLGAITHPANVQDRDGAPDVVAYARESLPTLAHLFADGGYAGKKLEMCPARYARSDERDRQATGRRGLRRNREALGRRTLLRLARAPGSALLPDLKPAPPNTDA
ncbi:MAG: transposase [Porphyrobacter sp.]|nr:transposase [Porphyrobacter sp.]